MMKSKRGEMTTQQIVILVILVISFAVLLFFLFRLNLGNETEKETCRNSVVTRGSAIIPTGGVPLQCKREYVCITEDKSCEKMTKPEKYQVETKEEVYRILADQMVDCWWMFGEGKINYVGKDMKSKLYCSICSQVAFDDSISGIFPKGEFEKKEFYQYLAITNMSNSDQSYAKYLFGSNEIDKLYQGDFGKVHLEDIHYVMMGITSDVTKAGWIAGGAVAVGGLALVVVSGPVGWVTAAVVAGAAIGGGGGAYVASVVEGASGNDYILPSLIKANSQEFNDLDCQKIATLS